MKLLHNTLYEVEAELERDSVKAGVQRYKRLAAEADTRGEGAALKPAERLLVGWFKEYRKTIRKERRGCEERRAGVGRGIYGQYMRTVDSEKAAVIAMHTTVGMCLAQPAGIHTTKVVLAIGRNLCAQRARRRFRRPPIRLQELSEMEAQSNLAMYLEPANDGERVTATDARRAHLWAKQKFDAGLKSFYDGFDDVMAKVVAKRLVKAIREAEAWQALIHTDKKQIKPKGVLKVARKFFPEEVWPLRVQGKIGAMLLELLVGANLQPKGRQKRITDWRATVPDGKGSYQRAFEVYKVRKRRRTYYYIRLTPEADKVIRGGHTYRQVLHPQYQPMVVRPITWTQDERGGYLEHEHDLIKKSRGRGKQHELIPDAVLAAVNTLDATPWRINRRILEVAQKLRDQGGGIPGIPRMSEIPKPPMPSDFDTNPDAKKAWKRQAARIHEQNVMLKGERVVAWHKLDIAERFRDYRQIYFPHDLDFRGRAYAIPLFLNHQGDDLCRGLLEFAQEKPINDQAESVAWVEIHLANCCGVDGGSFSDRRDWALANVKRFEKWHESPLENTDWLEVDKPFQALAAAFALCDLYAAAHLPVQVDGSNNALQHYAAMLRCPETAALANLTPSETPSDAYAEIGEYTRRLVAADAEKGNEYSLKLEGWITRKVVKQPAMTSLYGVTPVGTRRQLHEGLDRADFQDDNFYGITKRLTQIVRRAIAAEWTAAHNAMVWLAKCARLIAKSNQPIRWTTPLGLRIESPYRNAESFRIETILHNLLLHEVTDDCPVHLTRQVNGFAPNFVHSIDATHMMMTANRAREAGVQTALSFAGVHDSFWTHAADMDILGRLLRESFVELHEKPLLNDLHRQMQTVYPKLKFPPPPQIGAFDIREVLKSDYFFS